MATKTTGTATLQMVLTAAEKLEMDKWVQHATQAPDLFFRSCCGYWLAGMEQTKARGWLCYEFDDRTTAEAVMAHPDYPDIVAAWRAGRELPARWYRLDKAAATRAFVEGIKRGGVKWAQAGSDAEDAAVQMALLGALRYG